MSINIPAKKKGNSRLRYRILNTPINAGKANILDTAIIILCRSVNINMAPIIDIRPIHLMTNLHGPCTFIQWGK